MQGPPMQLSQWPTTTVDPSFFDEKKKICCVSRARFLLYLNLAGAIAHLALAITTLIVAGANGDVNTPIASTYTIELSYNNASSDPYIPSIKKFGSFSIPWATFSFFLMSALAHGLVVGFNWTEMRTKNPQLAEPRGWLRGWYLKWLSDCKQPARWFEYFFSAPLMGLLIAVVGGNSNLFLLIALYLLLATTIVFGDVAELLNQKDSDGTWMNKNRFARLWPSLLGWIPYAGYWTVVLWNFHLAVQTAADNGREVPGFVFGVVYGEVILFSIFSVPQLILLGLDNGPSHYWIGECIYLVLSLTSKALLGLLFIFSVLAFDSLEESVTA